MLIVFGKDGQFFDATKLRRGGRGDEKTPVSRLKGT